MGSHTDLGDLLNIAMSERAELLKQRDQLLQVLQTAPHPAVDNLRERYRHWHLCQATPWLWTAQGLNHGQHGQVDQPAQDVYSGA